MGRYEILKNTPGKKKEPQGPERHPVASVPCYDMLCLTAPSGYTVYVPSTSVSRHTRTYVAELLIRVPVDVGDRIMEELKRTRGTGNTGPK